MLCTYKQCWRNPWNLKRILSLAALAVKDKVGVGWGGVGEKG